MIHTDDHAPAHCHIYRLSPGRDTARVGLDPVEVWDYIGFKPHERTAIMDIINRNQAKLLAAWDSLYPVR